MVTNIEPYAIKLGQHLQKQWNLLLKYIEGPIYDKTIEIAEQVRINRKSLILRTVFYPGEGPDPSWKERKSG
jgi:hypothetical protein